MSKRILITGGAGFIGSHLADELLACGHHVRILDRLAVQVHGAQAERPAYLNRDVELFIGDVRNVDDVERSIKGVDAVYHLAATVGVGQSMYEVNEYTSNNDVGTAVLLEALIKHPVEKLIVASSMSVYGEGLYRAPDGSTCVNAARSMEQLRQGLWEVIDPRGDPLTPVPTPETKAPALNSVYALSKYSQERLCLVVGSAYQIPTVALRFFNTYGPRQALSNPYTGVLAIFASRYMNNRPPLIFEDGRQKRDFVSVYDVARACRLTLEAPGASGVFNIGSGRAYSIMEVAEQMACVLNKTDIEPRLIGKYRVGDIRHCFADIALARENLNYRPSVSLEEGIVELAAWLEGQVAQDRVESASAELATRGLTV